MLCRAELGAQPAAYCDCRICRRSRMTMHVYFIQQCKRGPIKIGIAADPKRRLEGLQTGNPQPLRLLGFFAGGRAAERLLHDRFRTDHIRGEWFAPSEELLALVASLTTDDISADIAFEIEHGDADLQRRVDEISRGGTI